MYRLLFLGTSNQDINPYNANTVTGIPIANNNIPVVKSIALPY
tara:strand:- start:94 stop:222 length:129 start_codon:yes stop_codon:yes gene_type:complete